MPRLPALLILLAACGSGRTVAPGQPGTPTTRTDGGASASDGGTPRMGTHAARCAQGCVQPAAGPCATANTAACADDCLVRTEGLSVACATCLVEQSGWAGRACSCMGLGCNACGFGPGDHVCSGAAPTDSCTPADESCDGFEQAPIAEGACRDACVGMNAMPQLGALEDRCTLACRRPAAGPCAAADERACITSCTTRYQGLPPACALCAIDASGWAGRACGCYGAGCDTCGFGPQPSACQNPLPEDTCAPADEMCSGFQLGETSSGSCADLCR